MEETRNAPKVKSTGVGTHARMAHNIKQLDNEITAGHSTNGPTFSHFHPRAETAV